MIAAIDAIFERSCASLPSPLAAAARALPSRLGLAPAGVTWGEVFKHEVTLAVPAYFKHLAPAAQVERAAAAHMLAVIEAFGCDRIADGQLAEGADAELLGELLAALRVIRDREAAALVAEAPWWFERADRESRVAIGEEHRLLAAREAVDEEGYRRVSLGKQAVGFPATVALMTAAGCSEDALDDARRALEGIWLGLQFHDDVIDWEDDWQRAGAWAACLAKGRGASIDDDEAVETLRTNVLASGVLAQMLELSRDHFASAHEAAGALEAHELAAWAAQKHDELDALFKAERAHPGYALRAHQLRHLMLAGSPLVDGDTIRHSREGGNP